MRSGSALAPRHCPMWIDCIRSGSHDSLVSDSDSHSSNSVSHGAQGTAHSHTPQRTRVTRQRAQAPAGSAQPQAAVTESGVRETLPEPRRETIPRPDRSPHTVTGAWEANTSGTHLNTRNTGCRSSRNNLEDNSGTGRAVVLHVLTSTGSLLL